ncbi:MAG: hypothetical protein JO142_19460 [Burkholderiales bacterium]|nr:hypothetical protein [Burkholderiales bacterium]
MPITLKSFVIAVISAAFCVAASAQSTTEAGRPAAVIPLESEAAPKLIAYAPLPTALARGVVIIQFRTENMRILPVFGNAAASVSPRIGHLHISVDDWPGMWAHTSADPIVVNGLKPGPHKILLELADPNHKIVSSDTVEVVVPEQHASEMHTHS